MKYFFIVLLVINFSFCSQKEIKNQQVMKSNNVSLSKATFAGGCFWCTEAVFLEIEGVHQVVSGYIGGDTENPTYEEISTGETGHAEAIEITFDSNKVSYLDLLKIFFSTHDPTTLNRQGDDIGTQYRSEIFYHSAKQKDMATELIHYLNNNAVFADPIVTKVSAATTFYLAEESHQNYYERNKEQSYCTFVILPKLEKLKENFEPRLKK